MPEPLLAASIRDLLLPLPFHQAAEQLKAATIGDLLALPLESLSTAGITPRLRGRFIVHLFDFLFLVNEPASGTPAPVLAENDPDLAARLLLAPWFTMATLQAGQELLDRGEITNTIIQQKSVGGLFIENKKPNQILIRFTDSPRSPSGFSIDKANCTQCGPSQDQRSLCCHAAALALSMMTPDPHQPQQLRPRPFLFPDSPWQLAADILYDLYGAHPPSDLTTKRENDHWRLTADSDFRSISWRLTSHEMKECATLFGARLPKKKKPAKTKITSELRQLYINLTKLATPEDFDDLEDLDEETISPPGTDPKRAASFWGWLATSFSLAPETPRFRLEGPADNTLFSLTAHDAADNVIFALALPRARTPDILDGLCRLGLSETAEKLPAITRAVLDDNTDLHIESCLRCPDGTVISRTELEPHRYGRYYHLEGKGFVAVQEQTTDNTLSDTPLNITTIEANNVPEFIKTHQHALNADENEVESNLKQLTVTSMPDRLNISQGKMDDDWCYLAGSYGFGNDKISLEDLLQARQKGRKYAATSNNWLKLKDGPLSWLHDLEEDRIWNDENGVPKGVRLSKPELLMLSSLIGEVNTSESDKNEDYTFASLLNTDAWLDPRQLPSTPDHLRDYQKNGLAWLFNLYQYRMGGILADDMGLGKTHQALALLQAVQTEQKNGGRFLVVCPATVVSHWVEKTRNFYPDMDYHVYHGIKRDLGEAKKHNLIITTFGIVRRDALLLNKLNFDTIILDEVQHLKNKKTEMYKAACLLHGRVTIGLTGTPLENSTNDLKSIFDLCLPGLLGTDNNFNKHYAQPIEERNDKKQRDRLARLIQPFLLRRAKPQVLKELPDVIEDIRTCELSEDQVTLYREIVEQRGRALINGLDDPSGKKPAYMEVLAVISYLKQICDHPALLTDPKEKRTYRSGKWDLFVELLDECLASNMKVVVFSHY
ncbi:MAG: DEAD/DEAH box helicase, partial [Desulfobulbaceae bacterium]|nr:DEAD/DEAH box helicase [Desulfobulbaceae bacterium]